MDRRLEQIEVLCSLLREAEGRLRAMGSKSIWSTLGSGLAMPDWIAWVTSALDKGEALTPEQASELWGIFAPTGDWDDLGGDVELGNRIFAIVNRLFGSHARDGRPAGVDGSELHRGRGGEDREGARRHFRRLLHPPHKGLLRVKSKDADRLDDPGSSVF